MDSLEEMRPFSNSEKATRKTQNELQINQDSLPKCKQKNWLMEYELP